MQYICPLCGINHANLLQNEFCCKIHKSQPLKLIISCIILFQDATSMAAVYIAIHRFIKFYN